MKKQLWQLSNTMKKETKEKFENLLEINLVKYSSKFLTHIKKKIFRLYRHIKKCSKSSFGVDITKMFSYVANSSIYHFENYIQI